MSRLIGRVHIMGAASVLVAASWAVAAGPSGNGESSSAPNIFGPAAQVAVLGSDPRPPGPPAAAALSRSPSMPGAMSTPPAPSIAMGQLQMERDSDGVLGVDARSKADRADAGSSQELTPLPWNGEGSKALANGLSLQGTVSYQITSFVEMWADEIRNTRASGSTSGTIRLEPWATTSYPVFGTTISYYDLGGYSLGQLPGGYSWYNVYSGTLAYSPPPTGCYWVTMALVEYTQSGWVYQDLVTFDSRVGFGTSCAGCTDDLEHGVVCLLNDRFRFQMSWTGFDNVTQPVVFVPQSDQTAAGVFQNNRNDITLVVKVTNGCSFTGAYWVWLGGFTNAAWNLQVTDTQTGRSRVYTKGLTSTPPVTVKDDSTFSCP